MKTTYGAKHGKGSGQCGTYMYSEIAAAMPKCYYDKTTQTVIGYLSAKSGDGWTEAGTWFSFNDKNSVQAITQYIGMVHAQYVYIYMSCRVDNSEAYYIILYQLLS